MKENSKSSRKVEKEDTSPQPDATSFSLDSKDSKDKKVETESSMISCKLCSRQVFKRQLQFHMKVRHSSTNPQEKANEDDVKRKNTACTDSSATTSSTNVLKKPKKPRERHYIHQELKCARCHKSFCSKHSLQRHVHTIHSKRKPIMCYFCDAQYRRQEDIYKHLKIKHLKEVILKNVRISCTICFKIFKAKQNLQRHIRYVHKGIQGFKCHFCDQRFTQLGHANRHIKRFHLNEKKVKVPIKIK